jgi:hypothetical protein
MCSFEFFFGIEFDPRQLLAQASFLEFLLDVAFSFAPSFVIPVKDVRIAFVVDDSLFLKFIQNALAPGDLLIHLILGDSVLPHLPDKIAFEF